MVNWPLIFGDSMEPLIFAGLVILLVVGLCAYEVYGMYKSFTENQGSYKPLLQLFGIDKLIDMISSGFKR